MAQPNLNEFNTPDIIRNLPEFHGDPRTLHNFLNNATPVMRLVTNAPEAVRPFWAAAIRNKIRGAASERLRLYGEPDTWANIRTCLVLHFSENRDKRTLYNELTSLRQTHGMNKFYDEILEIITALNQKVTDSNELAQIKQAEIQRNLAEGLQVFMNGVHEPLRTILLSRNPPTLSDAYKIALTTPTVQQQYSNRQRFDHQQRDNRQHFQTRDYQQTRDFRQNFHQTRDIRPNNYAQARGYQPNGNQRHFQPNNNYRYHDTGNVQSRANFYNGNNANNHNAHNRPVPMEVDRNSGQSRQSAFVNRSNGSGNSRRPQVIAEELFTNENNFLEQGPEYQAE